MAEKKVKSVPVVKEADRDVWSALSDFQSQMKPLPRNGKGSINGKEYSWVTLDDLVEGTRELLRKNGLVISQALDEKQNLVTVLHHIASLSDITSVFPLGIPSNIQELGARITYLRRYEMTALLGISAETDVDGAAPKPASTATATVENFKSKDLPPKEPNTKGGEISESKLAPVSQNLQKARDAVESCENPDALELFKEKVAKSTRFNDSEKQILFEDITRKEEEFGIVHTD